MASCVTAKDLPDPGWPNTAMESGLRGRGLQNLLAEYSTDAAVCFDFHAVYSDETAEPTIRYVLQGSRSDAGDVDRQLLKPVKANLSRMEQNAPITVVGRA